MIVSDKIKGKITNKEETPTIINICWRNGYIAHNINKSIGPITVDEMYLLNVIDKVKVRSYNL